MISTKIEYEHASTSSAKLWKWETRFNATELFRRDIRIMRIFQLLNIEDEENYKKSSILSSI